MPFKTVNGAKKRVKSLKNLSDKQIEVFISAFNDLESKGVKEDSAIPQAISAAKKVTKSVNEASNIIMDINKNTYNDKRKLLSDAVSDGYVIDFDDNYVYIEYWDEEGYETYRHKYSISDSMKITLSPEREEVVKLTEYKAVEEDSLEKKLHKFLDKYFGKKEYPIIKQFNEEQMISVEPMYIGLEEVDAHGWKFESQEVIDYMVESFNKSIKENRLQHGLFHKHTTNAYKIIKAWVNPCDCMMGETFVKQGDPLLEVQYLNPILWQKRKLGEVGGFSIGAKGTWEKKV